eukprot:scaffold339545_cov19-Prasinocladus_malaysianus.AAC.1
MQHAPITFLKNISVCRGQQQQQQQAMQLISSFGAEMINFRDPVGVQIFQVVHAALVRSLIPQP